MSFPGQADPGMNRGSDRRRRNAAIDDLFRRAARERDVKHFLQGLVEELHATYGAAGAAVWLARPQHKGELPLLHARAGPACDACADLLPREAPEWARSALVERRPLLLLGLATGTAAPPGLAAAGLHAAGAYPLAFDNEVFALLVLLWDRELGAGEASGLDSLVERAAVTLMLLDLLAIVGESEEKHRALLESAADAILIVDVESGAVIACNRKAEELTGMPRDEFVGRPVWKLPGPQAEAAMHGLFPTTVDAGERRLPNLRYRRPDGSLVRLDLSATPIHFGGRAVVQVVLRDATELHELHERLEEHAAQLEQRIAEKTAELRRSQANLVQSEKMAAIGSLVAGVAHEINTPVGSILSNVDTAARCGEKIRAAFADPAAAGLRQGRPELDRALRILDDTSQVMRSACERIRGIVQNLKNFVRLDEGALKSVDLREGVESTLALVRHELRDRIEVVREYGQLPEVECHPNQINQVFINLLVNAAQAIAGAGSIYIRAWHEPPWVKVEFRDSGVGIAGEDLERIFTPGFTTKPAGVGTGLGLSIVRQILDDHCGTIAVESAPGKGSVFTVSLPARRC